MRDAGRSASDARPALLLAQTLVGSMHRALSIGLILIGVTGASVLSAQGRPDPLSTDTVLPKAWSLLTSTLRSRDLQEQLVKEGYPVRVYVPFGTHWYPYFMRRLAERPANIWFFISNYFRK